jgi:hypothetical protein
MRFPEVTGSNLLRSKITLPDDLQGELNILFIAFYQWHQALVDSWVPWAQQIVQAHPNVQFYEIPVIRKMNFLSRTFINEGMRAGIPNPTSREKTITLYLDKEELRRALEIPDEETIRILILDHQGNILSQTEGAFSQEKADFLFEAIQEHLVLDKALVNL